MSQTNILLESGTNELEIVEFFIDEAIVDGDEAGTNALKIIHEPGSDPVYRGYYGVNVAKVLEIIQLPHVTPLPESKNPSILGAFNLRSQIIPLIDLSTWLDKSVLDNRTNDKVVVTEFNNTTTAFKVSGVNRIHRISWENVYPPNAYMTAFSKGCITGLVRLEDRIIFILDLERIMTTLNPSLGLSLDESIDWNTTVRKKALICDDSGLVRDILHDLLPKAGFDVNIVANGQEAWDELVKIRSQCDKENRPITDFVQVVISDIEMPSMDGHTLCRQIKEDKTLRQLPVVLFSSIVTDKLRHKGDVVGADDQVYKPNMTLLAQRCHELIHQNFPNLG